MAKIYCAKVRVSITERGRTAHLSVIGEAEDADEALVNGWSGVLGTILAHAHYNPGVDRYAFYLTVEWLPCRTLSATEMAEWKAKA